MQTFEWNCRSSCEPLTRGLYFMQIMAVVAGGRVHVAAGNSLAMHRVSVHRLFVVALDTFGNGDLLVLFPVLMRMDISMAVGTADIFLHVHAVVMFGVFLFVAPFAGYLVNLGLPAHMLGKVDNLDMAAGTGIFPMHRGSKTGY